MEERLTVRIGANLSDFERKMSRMQSKMDGVGKSMSSVGSNMTKYITAPVAALATALGGTAITKGFQRLVGIDTAKAKLEALGHSAGGVEKIMDSALDSVKGTAFGLGEAATTAANAVAAGVEPGEDLTRYLSLAGDAAAIAGVDMQEMGGIFNKVQTSNKLQMGEMNQLMDRGIPIVQLLAEELGVAESEVTDLASAGEISAEDFLNAVESGFGGAAAIMGEKSFMAAFANMGAALGRLGASFLDAGGEGGGFFSQMKPMMAEITDIFDKFGDTAADWGVKFGEFTTIVIEKVKNLATWFSNLGSGTQKLIGVIAGIAVAAGPVLMVVGKIVQVVASLAPLLKIVGVVLGALTSPVGLVVAAIAALGAGFVLAYNKSETFRNFIDGLKDKFLNAWESAMEFKDKVVDAFNGILAIFKGDDTAANELLRGIGLSEENIDNVFLAVTKIQNFFGDMKEGIQTALDGISDFFIEQFQGVKDWWDSDGAMILSAMSTHFEGTMDAISNAVKFGLDLVVSLFETFAPIVEGIWNILWPTILLLVENVWEKIKLVIGVAMDLVQGIISGVAAIIEGDWSRFGEVLKDTAQSIWDRVVEFFGNMKENSLTLFSELFSGAKQWFEELKLDMEHKVGLIKLAVTEGFQILKDNAIAKVTEMYNSVTQWFSDLWSSVSDTVSNIKTAVTNRFTEFKDNAISRVKSMFDSVTSWFGDMRSNVSNTASNIKTAVTNRFTEFKDNAVERSRLMYEGVKGWFGDTYTNTKNRASNIRDGVSTRFTTMKENAVGAAKSMWSGVSGFFDDIWSDTTSLFNNMVDSAKELPGRIGSAIKNMASHAVDGVASMGKSLGDRLGSVVNGVVNGLNKVLGAIGVKKIPTISISTGGGGSGGGSVRGGHATSLARFSTGTMNGAIAEDMVGIVNDRGPGNGFGGATQELIRRDGKLYAPEGRDVEVNLKRGDEIFNGAQTQSLIASGAIPRFSQGTGTEGGDSGKKGLFGTLKDVVSNVWSYISDPKTAFGAIIDTVTPDFGGLSGFFGDMASGAFSFLKEKALSWLTGIFKENEGALGSGQKYAWMNHPITAGYSPNRPLPGYPAGFNGGRHYGVDFGTPIGTTVRAPIGGQLSSFWNEGGGKIAKLVTGQLRQFWMHMSSVSGSGSVSQGDIIGRTGNSGRWTTGPHVHYQAQQGSDALNTNTINPLKVINGYSNGGIVNKRQIAEIAEDGPEAVIPLSASKRGRANQLYDVVGGRIGRDDSKYYDRMINNQQTQIDQMTQAINVLLGIEDKSGVTESDIGRANDKYNARQTSKRGVTTGRLNYV